MADPHKRIIVDGIDFAGVVQFPRILGAITASLQPPRLILGLLMVTLLVTAGRLWDGSITPSMSPAGLLAGAWSESEQAASRAELERIVVESGWVPAEVLADLDLESETALDARQVRDWVEQEFRAQAAADGEDASPEAIERRRADALAVVDRIERVRPRGPFEAVVAQVASSFHAIIRALVELRPQQVFSHLGDLFLRAPVALWRADRVFTIAYGLLALLTFALGGGALARMAACQFAGQQRMRMQEAIDFALGTSLRLVGAPLVPLLYAALGIAVIIALGLLMTLPWLDVAGGLLYGLSLLVGLLLALLIVGYAGGLSLFIPAVACENCDAGDAAQRGYAYVASRPLHRLAYAAVGLAGLALGYVLVSIVAVATLNMTARLFGAFTTHGALASAGDAELFNLARRPMSAMLPDAHGRAAAWIIGLWETVVVSLVAAYVIVYHFAASTRIYLLMRRACDGQDIEEIWQPGLVPGTLVPIPEAAPGATPPGRAHGVLAGAVKQYAAARYGVRRDPAPEQPPPSSESAPDRGE